MLKLQYHAKYLKIIRVPNKDMHKSLQEFDFWHIQTADIVELIGPEKRIAVLLENNSKYFNDFTWWLRWAVVALWATCQYFLYLMENVS